MDEVRLVFLATVVLEDFVLVVSLVLNFVLFFVVVVDLRLPVSLTVPSVFVPDSSVLGRFADSFAFELCREGATMREEVLVDRRRRC